jgi:hypothetical protein
MSSWFKAIELITIESKYIRSVTKAMNMRSFWPWALTTTKEFEPAYW